MISCRMLRMVLTSLLLFMLQVHVSAFFLFHKVDSIRLVYDPQELILPGESFPVDVLIYTKGKVKKNSGFTGGLNLMWRYKIEVVGGSYLLGKVKVNDQLIPSKGKYIKIVATHRRKDKITHKLLLPLNYETQLTFKAIRGFDKAPGSSIDGVLLAKFNNGSSRVYAELNQQKESDLYSFDASGGIWSRGRFVIPSDFRQIENHHCDLTITSKRNAAVKDTFSVQLDYKRQYEKVFRGSSGSSGFSGSGGSNGSTAGDGRDADDGGDGGCGDLGPSIGVWCDLYHDSILNTKLLYVYMENLWNGQEFHYLVNPDGGNVHVSSKGGDGGSGGDGGDGGDGGKGQEGQKWIERHTEEYKINVPKTRRVIKKEKRVITNSEGKEVEIEVDVESTETYYEEEVRQKVIEVEKRGPGGDGGDGGRGGSGGLGAPGGWGGDIYLYFTQDAMPYQHMIVAKSIGGSGGKHGSAGNGGDGGDGGNGDPRGNGGSNGSSGSSAIGWASDGGNGRILIDKTEEFVSFKRNDRQLD